MCATAWFCSSAMPGRRLRRPRLGVERGLGLALEERHHVLGDQLVGAVRRDGVGPLVGQQEHGAEALATGRPASASAPPRPRPCRSAPMPEVLTKSIISRTLLALDRHLREGGDLLEVAEPLLDAVLDVAVGLLARLGDVHEPDEAPLRAVDRGAEGLRALLHHVPVVGQRVEARRGQRGADRQQAHAVAAGQPRAGRRGDGGDRDVQVRLGVRAQVQPRVDELVRSASRPSPARRRVSSRMMTSKLSSSSSRVSVGLRPIMAESVGSDPGPTPSIARPRVRWSSRTMRSATQSGLW